MNQSGFLFTNGKQFTIVVKYGIMVGAEEKQAAAKRTFVFPAPTPSKRPAEAGQKSAKERVCEAGIKKNKRPRSGHLFFLRRHRANVRRKPDKRARRRGFARLELGKTSGRRRREADDEAIKCDCSVL